MFVYGPSRQMLRRKQMSAFRVTADVPTKAQNPPLLTVSVEKGASLRSLQNCQNTNDIFD